MNRISKILIAAAIVASSAGAASAQAFSSGWGTGNVQWTHYDSAGKLVLDNSQKNSIVRVDRGQNSVVRINRGNGALSSFASVPAGDAGAITVPGGSIGYNELLATH